MELTQSRLKELYFYNKETGDFIAKQNVRGGVKKGEIAGSVKKYKTLTYRRIGINYQDNYCHRLAWLHEYGYLPKEIDHINGNGLDNRLCNLREVTRKDNNHNQRKSDKNTSGVTGLVWIERYKGWQVQIKYENKNIYLGMSKDKFEAICIRKSAEARLGFHENHGKERGK